MGESQVRNHWMIRKAFWGNVCWPDERKILLTVPAMSGIKKINHLPVRTCQLWSMVVVVWRYGDALLHWDLDYLQQDNNPEQKKKTSPYLNGRKETKSEKSSGISQNADLNPWETWNKQFVLGSLPNVSEWKSLWKNKQINK